MHKVRNPRQRILKAGSIVFKRAGAIDCTVRNLSNGGACVEVASPIGIPDEFTLVIAKDNMRKPCHVAWRQGRRLGVQFVSGC